MHTLFLTLVVLVWAHVISPVVVFDGVPADGEIAMQTRGEKTKNKNESRCLRSHRMVRLHKLGGPAGSGWQVLAVAALTAAAFMKAIFYG